MSVLRLLVMMLGVFLGEPTVASEPTVLVDFRQPEVVQKWNVINDGVMGGVSTSQFDHQTDKAVFSGIVSLENNGGFASVRSAPERFELSAFQGIALQVRGDGKTYKFNVRTDDSRDGINYRSAFVTTAGEWIIVELPFVDFEPTFRGRIVPDAPPLDTSNITTLGFLIADRQQGPFQLEIRGINAIK
jgi:monofunctional biosynthetic peptidoglycan transglycosylase